MTLEETAAAPPAAAPGAPPPLASPATEAALEWPSLVALVAALAATDLGRERALALAPYADRAALDRHRRRHREAERLRGEGRLVPSFDAPLGELLTRLSTGRPPLSGGDLVRLAAMARATAAAARRVAAADPPCPELSALAAGLPDLSALEREIASKLDRRGEVRDDASPELVALRRRIRSVRDQLYRELGGFVGEHRDALGDDTIPMRGGRLVVVLDAGARGRVPGLVHGRSATGRSFYFEPLGVVEQNNTLQQASEDEEAERRRILAELLARTRAELPALERHAGFLAELDLLEAAATFAATSGGRLPDAAERHDLALAAARHPLLDPRLADLRREVLGHPGHTGEVVPLDLAFDRERRALVVTGPNAGGKTVALKTVGLLALAAQSGLPVPAGAGTRFPHLTGLVATVGDEQDLLAERSTFSGRLLRLDEAWRAAGPDALLLIDELGSGTDPEEGSALGVAFLEGVVERGALAVITTHLTQVAAAALELPGATCAAMEFDPSSGQPTYHLLPGPPGGSEALALARRLGLPAAWLDRAEARLGREHRDLQRLLAEVEEVRRELAAERDRAAAAAADAEKLAGRLAEKEAALAEERRRVGQRLKAELDAFRRQTLDRLREETERMREEIAAGRRKGVAAQAVERLFAEAPEVAPAAAEDEEVAGELAPGATVRHRLLGWQGTLEKLDRGRAEVAVRGKRLACRREELALVAPASGAVAGSTTPRREADAETSPEPTSVAAELHLIGERVEPALDKLDDYLDRALLASRAEVRVVHGHGSGRLRQAVREHLRGHPAVAAQRPGEANEGGNGATVVTLRGGA
ncbi:MAG TPA: Smr/MutS family protein [Thermoanaerobaculia bacterium]|nr:Smr/MutS family protein [Thermoanaerobaculia bacterium]